MPYVSSHGRRCIVASCSNTEKARYSLLNSKCNLHRQLRKNCKCEKNVFKFHKFPSDSLKRKVWVKNVNREDVNFANSRRSSFVICSVHFPDEQPSKEHPYPILHMQGPPPQQESVPGVIMSVQKTEEDVEKEILYVVTSLCDIVCEDDTTEETVDPISKTPSATASVLEDSLSARRNKRTIKKTFKARTFEAEKLFNRIRFGRPENRTILLPLLRQTIGLPKVKECFVRLDKIDVATPIKLSELENHPILCHEINRPPPVKVISVKSLPKVGGKAKRCPVKRKVKLYDTSSFENEIEDEDSFAEEDFDDHEDFDRSDSVGCFDEISESDQNEVNEMEIDEVNEESFEDDNPVLDVNEDNDFEDEELNADDETNDEIYNEEVCNENSTELEEEEDIHIQEDIVIDEETHLGENTNFQDDVHELDFEVEEEPGEIAVVKPTPMSVKRTDSPPIERSLLKASPFSVKHFSHNFDDELPDLKKNDSGSSVKVTFYKPFGNKTRKAVPVVTLPKRKSSFKISLTNPEQKMLPGTSFKRSVKRTNETNMESNRTIASMPLFPDVRNMFKHNPGVKIIQPFQQADRGFRSVNRNVDNYLISSFPSPGDPPESESLSDAAAELKLKDLNSERTLANFDSKLKGSETFSKIWMELHTYYDYTEEEVVTFYDKSDAPEDDDSNSSMMYEDDESDRNEEASHQNTFTDEKCVSETGLSVLVFKGLLGVLRECAPKHRTTLNMDIRDQVMIVLMKLKMGLINADLAKKFNSTPAICGKVFSQWLTVLHDTLNHMVVWNSREKNTRSMPEHFYEHLPLTTCLVDVGLISVQSAIKQAEPCENAAKNITSVKKFMYAVAPDGFVMHISKLFDACDSENSMFSESAIKDKLVGGDLILASREVVDSEELSSGLTFDVLPHLKPENEGHPLCEESKNAVGRLKVFRVLRGVITVPLSSAPNIIHTCAALSNLGLIR